MELKQFRSRDVLKCRCVLITPCENTKDESALPNPCCIPKNAVGKSPKVRKMPGASEDGSSMHWHSEVSALLASPWRWKLNLLAKSEEVTVIMSQIRSAVPSVSFPFKTVITQPQWPPSLFLSLLAFQVSLYGFSDGWSPVSKPPSSPLLLYSQLED